MVYLTLEILRYIFNNMKYKDCRTMDFIYHMRRSAFFPGRPGGLIREITWKAGDLYLQNEPIPMHYFSYGFL